VVVGRAASAESWRQPLQIYEAHWSICVRSCTSNDAIKEKHIEIAKDYSSGQDKRVESTWSCMRVVLEYLYLYLKPEYLSPCINNYSPATTALSAGVERVFSHMDHYVVQSIMQSFSSS